MSIRMKTYIAVLKHDKGLFRLKVTARNISSALQQIMNAEKCPQQAIKRLTVVSRKK